MDRNIAIAAVLCVAFPAALAAQTITGAPYSADAVTDSTQVLPDGKSVAHTSTMKLYRDSEGRERRDESEPVARIVIFDPIVNSNITLDPAAHTAAKSVANVFGPASPNPPAQIRGIPQGTTRLSNGIVVSGSMLSGSAQPLPHIEDLGSKTIEGIPAKGTRTTTGQTVDEVWYAQDLQTNVMTRHSDPRTGEIVYRLIHITRADPDPALFLIPPDYKVTESQTPGSITCRQTPAGFACGSGTP